MLAQVTFKGDGPLGGIQVIADALGNVKGKVGNPEADPPLRPDGKLNVGAAVGRGAVHFIGGAMRFDGVQHRTSAACAHSDVPW